MLLFSGNANPPLAQNIATILGIPLASATISKYPDGESKIEIHEDVQNQDVFIIQPTSFPVNTNILELCLLANALRNKQARNITAVMPYFGYGRHDGDLNNGPNVSRLIMELLVTAGVNRLLTLDLHSNRTHQNFDIAVKNISAVSLFVNILQIQQLQNPVIISPDMGGIKRAREFAKSLGSTNIATIDKQRYMENQAIAVSIIGNVAKRNCIIVDDIIDTANTIYAAAAALKKQGAQQIYTCCTHAVLSDNAIERLESSACDKIFITDSIMHPMHILNTTPKLSLISAANLLAAAIKR